MFIENKVAPAVSALSPILFLILALIAFIFAIVAARANKIGSSCVLAALFVLSTIFTELSHVETIEAFSVKVSARLTESEGLLKKLQRLSFASAKAELYAMDNLGRLGVAYSPEKVAFINSRIDQLKGSDASSEDLSEALAFWLDNVTRDLFMAFIPALKWLQFSSHPNSLYDPADEVVNKRLVEMLPSRISGTDRVSLLRNKLDEAFSLVPLSDLQKTKFTSARDRAVEVLRNVVRTQSVTPELVDFVQTYNNPDEPKASSERFMQNF